MSKSWTRTLATLAAAFAVAGPARADGELDAIRDLARCQKAIGREGARYATRVLKSNLNCTEEIVDCQVQCELGVFGASCETSPPPCCDSDDPGSNVLFGECMADAEAKCDVEAAKRALYEQTKQDRIISACTVLTQEQLCGAETPGLNFVTLNAGCQALDPSYTCNLTNMVNCVGGPLEHALLDQISAVLHPRASDAVAALNLHAQFPDLPLARKVKGEVAEGKVDVWQFTGLQAGDEIIVKVNTRDDNGDATSNLHPLVTLLDASNTPVGSTTVRSFSCGVPNVCGSTCPVFRRNLPFDGTQRIAVQAFAGDSCTGGKYRLVLISPGGVIPTLIADDVDPGP